MRTLNLGILAHVDAGKTTLTERLLFEAGAISSLGSVDRGTTQTDSLAIERERGITIRSAVATLAFDDLTVNILDTPGHPDFIAEVERVLMVLDGAVLVVSAVEGVQPQTPLLWRALERLHVPTIFFINKIDRVGADHARTLAQLRDRLTPDAVLLGTVSDEGSRDARFSAKGAATDLALLEQLAEHDEALMSSFVEDRRVPSEHLWSVLARTTAAAQVQPVVCGSAMTGVGTDELMDAIRRLLPTTEEAAAGALSARVFKVERSADGAKAALARVFSGSISVRERVPYGAGMEGKVIELGVYEPGGVVQRQSASAGSVARVIGLDEVRVGDWIGTELPGRDLAPFPPPTLESVVVPLHAQDRAGLRLALGHLAEQDPLINMRQDAENVFSVALYGEVQKEVIEATLARDYGVAATFRDTTTICIERPAGVGEDEQLLFAKARTNISGRSSPLSTNPYAGTLALRVEPAPVGSGVELRVEVDVKLVPLYIYNTTGAFRDQMAEYARAVLEQGRYGWRVTDCLITVTDCGYPRTGSSARDFRLLTGLVLTNALERAGTIVCEPFVQVAIELPERYLSTVMSHVAKMGARPAAGASGGIGHIRAGLAAGKLAELRRQLPGLSGGQGTLEADFGGYQQVDGPPPIRKRWSLA